MRPPGLVDRINYVGRALADHCDPPLQLYFTALFPALLTALLQLFAIDLQQIFWSIIRTKYFPGTPGGHVRGRDRRRQPRPKTWLSGPRRWLNWDPYDATGRTIGRWLPGTPGTPPFAAHYLMTFFGYVERLNFYFLIIEITTNFWYNYAVALHESEACQAARQPWMMAVGGIDHVSGILDPYPTLCPDIVKQRGSVSWNVNSGRVTNGSGSVSYTASLRSNPEFDQPNWRARLVVLDTTADLRFNGEWIEGGGGTSQLSTGAEEDHFYSIGVESEGFTIVDDQQVTLIGFTPDPV